MLLQCQQGAAVALPQNQGCNAPPLIPQTLWTPDTVALWVLALQTLALQPLYMYLNARPWLRGCSMSTRAPVSGAMAIHGNPPVSPPLRGRPWHRPGAKRDPLSHDNNPWYRRKTSGGPQQPSPALWTLAALAVEHPCNLPWIKNCYSLSSWHPHTYLQVKVFPHQNHSIKWADLNARLQETWKIKETWHHQRNRITFQQLITKKQIYKIAWQKFQNNCFKEAQQATREPKTDNEIYTNREAEIIKKNLYEERGRNHKKEPIEIQELMNTQMTWKIQYRTSTADLNKEKKESES